ncbi:MAG: SRPBCC domain-containing protein [Geodermatophilaceae bacterium]|nr:SRPBCC domain-containing protein [Geodermatophilaceae bacterium]
MTPALRMRLDVACSADHAFHTWTSRIAMWWPAAHTTTGEEYLDVVIEPCVGGRIYERTRSGREVDWGRVVRWDPPRRFAFRWHLGTDASNATDVELTFVPAGPDATTVDLVHTGWDRLGAAGPVRREGNNAGWTAVFRHFVRAIDAGPPSVTGVES